MSNIAISLKNVSKYYKLYNNPKDRLKEALSRSNKSYHKKFYATKNLNLEIKKSEILGIVGKNGSGKSTLLKLITGVLKPDEGSVKVNGKISALLELGSGFNPEFTGMQNIFFYGTILGFTKEEMKEKLNDILAFADIGDFINQPLKTYSSGMKSRLGFAVAVHIDPEILILDEVLAVGDVLFRRKCYAKMEEFFKGGKTIIYVSHDANSVKELCSRAIFLESGNIILDADAKTVSTYYEKSLFAKDKNKNKIREEIRELTIEKQITSVEKIKNKYTESNREITSSQAQVLPSKNKAYFIPDFTPMSTVVYDNTQIEIVDILIKTTNGHIVNALISGEKYIYCYRLKFHSNQKKVAFGMHIKTEKGLSISSTGSVNFNIFIENIKENEIYAVEWAFTCFLTPGTYYTNVGVSAEINNELKLINRITDALVFKVLPITEKIFGIVSLQQTPKYRLYKES